MSGSWQRLGDFVASGRVVDLILALTIAEAAILLLLHRRRGRGVAPAEFSANLLSGCLLLLAMRNYAGSGAWPWTAFCLAGSGAAHAADLMRRWR